MLVKYKSKLSATTSTLKGALKTMLVKYKLLDWALN